MGRTVRFVNREAPGFTVLDKFKTESAFTEPRFTDHADDLTVSAASTRQHRLQDLHLRRTANETSQPTGPRDIEAGPGSTRAFEFENPDRSVRAGNRRGA